MEEAGDSADFEVSITAAPAAATAATVATATATATPPYRYLKSNPTIL